jgi:hypothetical protein
VKAYAKQRSVRVITPGSSAGELLHVLSSLERRSERWGSDLESARAALSAAVSLVLRLLGRDPDPAKSREHVLLSVLAERRLLKGQSADLEALLEDLADLPIETIGALEVDDFLPKSERKVLAAAINTLLASPSFATCARAPPWTSAPGSTDAGRTPAVIVSVAHLDDEERALVAGRAAGRALVMGARAAWVESLARAGRVR